MVCVKHQVLLYKTHVAKMGVAEGWVEPGPVGLHCNV